MLLKSLIFNNLAIKKGVPIKIAPGMRIDKSDVIIKQGE
jgi:hypothetical protein